MKKMWLMVAVLLTAAVLAGSEALPLKWSEGLNSAKRFVKASSGELAITQDEKENAVRFDVTFQPGKDFWCYPRLRLAENEVFPANGILSFEFKAEQQDEALGYAHALVMFDPQIPKSPRYTLPPPKKTWQTVTIDLAKAVSGDAEKIRQLAIGMNPRSPRLTWWVRNIRIWDSPPPKEPEAATVLSPAAPGAVFTKGEALEFTARPDLPRPLNWTLTDWQGTELTSGSLTENTLRLAALPEGYYFLKFPGFDGTRSFTVVPDPAERRRNPNTYFALDTAQSVMIAPQGKNPRQPSNGYEVISDIVRRGGLEIIRDRLSWRRSESRPGKYDWAQFARNIDLLNRRGVEVCNVYHDAPEWTRPVSRTLPDDLNAVYRFSGKLAETFRGKVAVWEFWNEPDIRFALESAWDYAAAMKAAYLGFKAGDPDLPVASGAFSNPALPNYCHVVMQNGLSDYFDIFNVHIYEPLKDYPELADGIRRFQERYNMAGRPVWLTESGCRMEGLGQSESHLAGIRAHSPEQELYVAEFLAKSMIILQSLGVDRNFFFVLGPYNESGGKKDWGLMRRDFTVKPGYTAFSNLMHQLGSAQFEGTLAPAEGVRAFLYRQPDGSRTLVYWSVSSADTGENRYFDDGHRFDDLLDRPFQIPVPAGNYRGVNLFGTPFECRSSGDRLALTASRMPTFVNGLSGLKPQTPFHATAKSGSPRETDYDRSLIFRTVPGEDFELAVTKDCVDVKKDGAAMTLQVWNLSDREKTGRVAVSGCAVTGLPGEITVPAFGKIDIPLTVDAPAAGTMEVTGDFNGRAASRLVMPMTNMRKMIASAGDAPGSPVAVKPLGQMMNPEKWRANASGKMQITYDEAENAVRFETKFPASTPDFWVYPEYRLEQDDSFRNVYGIVFEVKVDKPKQVEQMQLMRVPHTRKEHGDYVGRKFSAPKSTEWEERIVVLDAAPSLADGVRMLRLGLNTKAQDITYWIRNVRVVYKH